MYWDTQDTCHGMLVPMEKDWVVKIQEHQQVQRSDRPGSCCKKGGAVMSYRLHIHILKCNIFQEFTQILDFMGTGFPPGFRIPDSPFQPLKHTKKDYAGAIMDPHVDSDVDQIQYEHQLSYNVKHDGESVEDEHHPKDRLIVSSKHGKVLVAYGS